MSTQKEWELETRLIKLEGGGLDALMAEFNQKIDSIFANAIDELSQFSAIAKRTVTLSNDNIEFVLRGQSRGAAQSQHNYNALLGMANAGMGGCSGMAGASGGMFGGAF
tara:strand:+ start:17 stop:343 length:327 start_codon:yes stop_codon:yes gene_type:complete